MKSILKAPHITEKATNLAEKNQYVFKVWGKANKNEIKKAIESLYKVKVMDVKIINVPAKRRRLGRNINNFYIHHFHFIQTLNCFFNFVFFAFPQTLKTY